MRLTPFIVNGNFNLITLSLPRASRRACVLTFGPHRPARKPRLKKTHTHQRLDRARSQSPPSPACLSASTHERVCTRNFSGGTKSACAHELKVEYRFANARTDVCDVVAPLCARQIRCGPMRHTELKVIPKSECVYLCHSNNNIHDNRNL